MIPGDLLATGGWWFDLCLADHGHVEADTKTFGVGRRIGMVCCIVDHYPVVRALPIFAWEVLYCGPEEGVTLCGRPHSLVDLVGHHSVIRDPFYDLGVIYQCYNGRDTNGCIHRNQMAVESKAYVTTGSGKTERMHMVKAVQYKLA